MNEKSIEHNSSFPTSSLSVVIPSKNAGTEFESLLAMLRQQKDYGDLEILVVDSGSTDDTPECAKRFGARVLSIDPHSFNHGETRNLGIRETKGEFVFLFTQDALPSDNDYLCRMLESMKRENAAGLFARQIPRPDASPLVRRDLEAWIGASATSRVAETGPLNSFLTMEQVDRYHHCVFDNVASLIRRSVWEKIPFSHTPFGEDIDWSYRVLCNGYKIVYEPEASVIHSHERSARYQYRRTFVDHYKLYELFSLRTIPSRRLAWRSFLVSMMRDWKDLLKTPHLSWPWFKGCLNVPRYAWASVWGQYRGAKSAASGIPFADSHEV